MKIARDTVSITKNGKYSLKGKEIKLPETFEYGTTTEDIKPTESTYGTFIVHDEDPSAVSSASVSYNSDSTNSMLVETKTIWVQFIPHEKYANNFAEFIEKIVITIVKKKVEFTDSLLMGCYYSVNAPLFFSKMICGNEFIKKQEISYFFKSS